MNDSYLVSQLYEFTPKVEPKRFSRPNPLTSAGALDEAELIDVRLSPQRSRIGILCDIRWCQNFEGSNTALIVLTGVGNIRWSNSDSTRQRPWHACYGEWQPQIAIGVVPPFSSQNAVSNSPWALDVDCISRGGAAAASPPTAADEAAGKLDQYTLELGQLSVTGLAVQIYIGHINGIDGAPPDMGELSDAEIIAGFPQWTSDMQVREHYTYPGFVDDGSS